MKGSVTERIEGPPSAVWAVVSDVTRIGELSPETFEGRWIDGATGPEVGARFQGHVKRNGRGPTYWTTCRVTECEVDRVFEADPATEWLLLTMASHLRTVAKADPDDVAGDRLDPDLAAMMDWASAQGSITTPIEVQDLAHELNLRLV